MTKRPVLLSGMLMALVAVFAITGLGCASSTTDATDPDPGYYKGKQFTHKKTG